MSAGRIAEQIDKALEKYWVISPVLALEGAAEYEAACRAAARLESRRHCLNRRRAPLMSYLRASNDIERCHVAEDRHAVAALLDAVPVPELTFRQSAEQYIESHKAGWSNAKHAQQWPSTLWKFVYPVIGDIPVAQLSGRVGTQKIKAVLDPIWYTKPTTASRVRGRSRRCWIGRRRKDTATAITRPAGVVTSPPSIPRRKSSHRRAPRRPALPTIPDFMSKLRSVDGVAARGLEFRLDGGALCRSA